MLQVKHISKQYITGSLVQQALSDVSLNLRDNEFVAILGPSGSGKTTLLNVIGGLDRYDQGDLIINGVSTKKYRDRDWDSYRNHTIGFVFQSYNLIPHQTVLANVELALTISGVGKTERRRRAREALEQVGLGDQMHKRPNQMSGGQMQRVAIARALVNNPDILLADEPTGALDTETSVQVMDLLKEVARDRLVVMVTHNPDLAEQYATRIVRLRDGKITDDTDPFVLDDGEFAEPEHRNLGRASMSLLTALSLSFNNLRTKLARTLLTAFAGSIGIIGIALIMSISTGVNAYIKSVEQDTLSEYPLQIQSSGFSFASMMTQSAEGGESEASGEVRVIGMITNLLSRVSTNDLGALKRYFESGDSEIGKYTNAVEYVYSVVPQIYRLDGDGVRQVNPDRSFSALGFGSSVGGNSMMSAMMSTDVFYAMPANTALFEKQYDIKAGRWPENGSECLLVLTGRGAISDFLLYTLGLRDAQELDDMIARFAAEENVEPVAVTEKYRYTDFIGITFKLVHAADRYVYDEVYNVWRDKSEDDAFMLDLVRGSEDLTIVGVAQPAEGATATMLTSGIWYPAELTDRVTTYAASSRIVREQLDSPAINVITGEPFGEENRDFDLSSLFSIDEEAFGEAFQFDPDALELQMPDGFSLDASGLDLSGLSPDAALGDLDLAELFSGIELRPDPEQLRETFSRLSEGYGAYAADDPRADFSRLGEAFRAYLQTPEAQQQLRADMGAILEANGEIVFSAEQLGSLVYEILTGFRGYAETNGITDPDAFDDALRAYLETEEAQQVLNARMPEVLQFGEHVAASQEQMDTLTANLVNGYRAYAQENELPSLAGLNESFAAYMQTEEAQAILEEGAAGVLDLSSVAEQLSERVRDSIGTALSASMSKALQKIVSSLSRQISRSMEKMMQEAASQLGERIESAFDVDPDAFRNAIQMTMSGEELSELFLSMLSGSSSTYEGNLRSFGYADPDKPSEIDIYPTDFESKAKVIAILDAYNLRMEESGQSEKVIRYTDIVGTLMSSVTDIVNIISYVLVAFVAISLIVSSIMIGVITYISVLERKKEIGILRAIGASKRNVSRVFNAETGIIGFCAGAMGIGITLLLLIPINAIVRHLAGQVQIRAVLPPLSAVILILLSIGLTLLGGLIPAKKAAHQDPVTALRTE